MYTPSKRKKTNSKKQKTRGSSEEPTPIHGFEQDLSKVFVLRIFRDFEKMCSFVIFRFFVPRTNLKYSLEEWTKPWGSET